MSGHQLPYEGKNNEWLTPPEIIAAIGPFDLDPCAPINRPWDTAKLHYTIEDDGLVLPWHGRVFLNSPYGPHMSKWLDKIVNHNNGIALTFARTETQWFHQYVWQKADAVFFFEGRLHFHYVTGERATFNAGAPSCLVAYGRDNSISIMNSGLKGKIVLV